MNACHELVALCEQIASETSQPREFLLRLGSRAAGIRRGPVGFYDLSRGGSNLIPGGGVKRRYDDDTDGQIRHFAGMATATVRVGPRLARSLSVTVLRDPPTSADGRLSDTAIEFARALLSGDLEVDAAPRWVSRRLCA